jgi:uncharacterized protein (TIGR00661 family)
VGILANILYGVMGEGRGHSSRSKKVIEFLHQQGHEVRIVSSNKGTEYLSKHFDVDDILGLEFVYKGHKVDMPATLMKNWSNLTDDSGKTTKKLDSIISDFKPNLIITDFEPFVPRAAKKRNIPFISIDHQHLMQNTKLEFEPEWGAHFQLGKTVANLMHSGASKFFITSFYFPKLKKRFRKNTELVGPILRDELFSKDVHNSNHILLYVTTPEASRMLDLASQVDEEFVAYGFKDQEDIDNIYFKEPSTDGFLQNLASSKAVVTNGGYTLMSEALFFGKPIYSLPLEDQFEQLMNAYYLQKEGYGKYELSPTEDGFNEFLSRLDEYKNNISRHSKRFNGNDRLFSSLQKSIDELVG